MPVQQHVTHQLRKRRPWSLLLSCGHVMVIEYAGDGVVVLKHCSCIRLPERS